VTVSLVADPIHGAVVSDSFCAMLTQGFRAALEGAPDGIVAVADAEHTSGGRTWNAGARDDLRGVLAQAVGSLLPSAAAGSPQLGEAPSAAAVQLAAEQVEGVWERIEAERGERRNSR